MIWVWIIIAVIVVAGLLFWVKSGNKNNETDLSADLSADETSETDVEKPVEAPIETPAEPEVSEAPEEEASSNEEDKRE